MNYYRQENWVYINENTGIKGVEVYEGQVFMTEEELVPFCVAEKDVLNAVKKKERNKIQANDSVKHHWLFNQEIYYPCLQPV
ncbi:MAG: hypothetical protein V8R78_08145 [Evtepia gabavorous]